MSGRVRLHLRIGLRRKFVAIDVKGFEDIGHHICTVVSTGLAVRSTCRENGWQWRVGPSCGLSSVERKASYTSEAHVAKMAGRGARGSGSTCGQDFEESLLPSLSRGSNTPVTTFALSLALVWLSEAHAARMAGSGGSALPVVSNERHRTLPKHALRKWLAVAAAGPASPVVRTSMKA